MNWTRGSNPISLFALGRLGGQGMDRSTHRYTLSDLLMIGIVKCGHLLARLGMEIDRDSFIDWHGN